MRINNSENYVQCILARPKQVNNNIIKNESQASNCIKINYKSLKEKMP